MTTTEDNRTIPASSGGGDIPVWTCAAGEGSRPGLLLVPAIFGVDEGTKTLARDLALEGAHVWCVDPFWRTVSPGVIVRDKDGFAQGIARARTVDETLATADFTDLIQAMGKEEGCNGQVVVLGICFAGKFALLLASQGHAAAGATFHGARMTPFTELAETIKVPLSLHFGDDDVAIPVQDVATLREAFKDHDNVDIVLHSGAQHGFGDPGSDGFNPEVYKKTLAAVRGLLDGLR